MIDVSKFKNEYIPFSVYALSIVVVGCIGYHIIRWLINKCVDVEKIDGLFQNIDSLEIEPDLQKDELDTIQTNESDFPVDLAKDFWWTKITETKEFNDFKNNLENLSKTGEAREKEAQKIQSLYKSLNPGNATNEFPYSAPVGAIYWIPGNFSLWMSGVALVAAYLSEKKKIKGLYVCETLESLSAQIDKISLNPANQRSAFIVGTFSSGSLKVEPNFPQHKVTVCVEKKDGKLSIALLDADSTSDILPEHLEGKLWSGYDQWDEFNAKELIFRAALSACRNSNSQARLLHSKVLRETMYGCETFALQDAMAFLRDPDFFNRITCSKKKTVIDQHYEIEAIKILPPEYMIGAQSTKIIEKYRKQGGQFDKVLPGKKKTLQSYLDANLIEATNVFGVKVKQNHYITKKTFKYLNLAVLSIKYLTASEIEKIISKTLVKN